MKILLSSVPFSPTTGGIQTVSAILADELSALGCEVVVVTQTPSATEDWVGYTVLRRPDAKKLLEAARWSDVVFHNNISLRGAWPVALLSKPWMIAHHTWLPARGAGALAGQAKRLAARRGNNVAISQAIARDVGVPCTVIPNPFDDGLFRRTAQSARDRDIVFVGRLVSDKGVAVLLAALGLLKTRGLEPLVTIVGVGPEEAALRQQMTALGLGEQVMFKGQVVGNDLVALLNQHTFMVIPSTWEEPFGIVALEGIACGCTPIAARSGGLPDAVGVCGQLFAKSDSADLAQCLESLIKAPERVRSLQSGAAAHLARHTKASVSRAYLCALEDTIVQHRSRKFAW